MAEDDFFVTRFGDGFENHWNGNSKLCARGRHAGMAAGTVQRGPAKAENA
jgi:hypothetical protein